MASFPSPTTLSLNHLLSFVSTKLDSEKFLVWKKKIDPLLLSQDLYKYVDPDVPIPSRTIASENNTQVPNPSYIEWQSMDNLLISFLQATFTAPTLSQTPSFPTSRTLYSHLGSSFASQVNARTHQLTIQLQTIQRGSQTINEYISQIKSIFDALANTSSPISDSTLVLNTLRGLGPDYDPFITAI
ncbi:hypothetical protein MKW98_001424 [Papaver atlanticum]|uniref:Uncharacterized protein n=1 Tax=Papaver atlanticum TaxID=357466 RepID=A0AAD4SXS5_9MAGN|nr:hypothetical protein MKW98_001424 [Papaver atlanticum]